MGVMQLSEFDYAFPPELLAKHPPKVRGQSRLLLLDRMSNQITHRMYSDFAEYVQPGDVVVLNDTKVIKARLIATNAAGQKRELLLIEKHGSDNDWHRHRCLYRGHVKEGDVLYIKDAPIQIITIEAEGVALVESTQDLLQLAEQTGSVPLPPYMKRQATNEDSERYQTVFAKHAGSVAAPTASLNFTDQLRNKLIDKGVHVVYLTLHVGLGTFLPIRTNELEEHKMHSEYFEIPPETIKVIQTAKASGHKVFAVGTTVTRTLEYCSSSILLGAFGLDGVQGSNEQRASRTNSTVSKSHSQLTQQSAKSTSKLAGSAGQLVYATDGSLTGEADIFIYPGYKFKVVDHLLTNFHAPKSTVLMMAAAFTSWDNLKHAYEEAIKEKYAFLSYGDSMLII